MPPHSTARPLLDWFAIALIQLNFKANAFPARGRVRLDNDAETVPQQDPRLHISLITDRVGFTGTRH